MALRLNPLSTSKGQKYLCEVSVTEYPGNELTALFRITVV